MTTAIAGKEKTELTLHEGGQSEALSGDVLIPRLLLMQGVSDFITQRQKTSEGKLFQQGDMVRSTSKEVVADPEHPLEFIPLTMQNQWIIQELVGQKYEYRKTLPRDGGLSDAKKPEDEKTGDGLPWEFTQNGTKWGRVKVINVLALLPSDIAAFQAEIDKAQKTGEMPDLNKTLLPVLISFRSTSFSAGRMVATHFTKAAAMAKYGAKAHGFTLKLGCSSQTNDKGTYYVLEVGQGRKVTAEELDQAEYWASQVRVKSLKVDEPESVDSSAVGGGSVHV